MDKTILLSFDVEEFDLPTEYGIHIGEDQQYTYSLEGLLKIIPVLKKENVKATFFVTSGFASRFPQIIKKVSKFHEVSSHNLNHQLSVYSETEVAKSKEILEKIIRKKVLGFRMPRLKNVNHSSLSKLGFNYDSSLSPSYLPGRYNNIFKKRSFFNSDGISVIPVSVFPVMRLPYWILFRMLGIRYLKILTSLCSFSPGFVNVYFHPWEFSDISKFKLPNFFNKENSGMKMVSLFSEYIRWCKARGLSFLTFSEFLSSERYNNSSKK